MKGDAEGRPMLYVFSTCTHLIRTLPAMQHDPLKPEDLDTEVEDHAVDEARYAAMSRPQVGKTPAGARRPAVIRKVQSKAKSKRTKESVPC
ncbi:unnamed protein product, partial [marine sediment metagenome]